MYSLVCLYVRGLAAEYVLYLIGDSGDELRTKIKGEGERCGHRHDPPTYSKSLEP